MGIGGAVLYSLAYMAARGLASLGALLLRLLRGLGRAFLEGAGLYGTSVAGGQWFHDSGNLPRVKDASAMISPQPLRNLTPPLDYQQKGVKTQARDRIMVPRHNYSQGNVRHYTDRIDDLSEQFWIQ